MIVAETEDRWRFVTQPDHAALAGRFAAHWGNDAFDRPRPRLPMLVAARDHDDGWWAYDRHPHLDENGRPVDFRELNAGTWIDLYDDGIDAVVERDAYAGLLVAMHGVGLRRRRYGLSPSWPAPTAEYTVFVERQEAHQEQLLDELRSGESRDRLADDDDAALLSALHETGTVPHGTASRLWRNYRLLQAWDTLSLSFCVTESPPAYTAIDAVPTSEGASDATLSVESIGDDRYRVEPYPFDATPLDLSVPVRTVRKDAFNSERSLIGAYYQAEPESVAFSLERPEQ